MINRLLLLPGLLVLLAACSESQPSANGARLQQAIQATALSLIAVMAVDPEDRVPSRGSRPTYYTGSHCPGSTSPEDW